MLNWLRPRTATVPELQIQLEAAQAELQEAEASTRDAVDKFDDDPSAGAKALAKARDREALAREHVGRAERLLVAAHEREAQRERDAKLKRLAELDRLFAGGGAEQKRQPALARLVDALEAAAAAETERTAIELELTQADQLRQRLEHELHGVEMRVTMPTSTPRNVDVERELERRAREHEHGSPMQRIMSQLGRMWGAR